MIYETTKGNVGLDDFEVPAQCTLRRVQHGEKRYSEDVDDMTLYYIKKKGSRQDPKCVLPASVQIVRSPLLCLDEGSVGTAGVAAAAFHLKKTIWVNPDKIHRVIRDLKLAEGHCCNKLFEGNEVVVSIPVWAKQQAIRKRCERFPETTLLFAFQMSEPMDGHPF